MARSKRQADVSATGPKLLARARASRDMVLRTIHKLDALAQEARTDANKQLEFKARVSMLDKYVDQFEAQQQEVLNILIDTEQKDEFDNTDIFITDEMEEVCARIRMVAGTVQTTSGSTEQGAHKEQSVQAASTITLPKIELPKFDGDVIQWCSFRDMFSSLVHNNQNISDIERFHFLKSSLSGPALAIIKSVPLTAANYSIAWSALHNSFENNRLLATAHIDRLFAFSPLKKESTAALASFVNTFRENVAAITALGIKDISGFLLFYIGARVLDTETRRLYEASILPSEIPTLDSLLNFVSRRREILENIGVITDKTVSNVKVAVRRGKGGTPEKSSFTVTSQPSESKCSFCERDHLLYRCFIFKQKAVSVRKKFVSSHNICFICLNQGHQAKLCPSTFKCRKCDGRHNTLLHIDEDRLASGNAKDSAEIPTKTVEDKTVNSGNSSKFSGAARTETTVVLGTAGVRVRDSFGKLQVVRVLLDSGSQVSAITSSCATRLGLRRVKSRIDVTGLSQQPVNQVKGVTECRFVPLHADEPLFCTSSVIILKHITTQLPGERLPAVVRERYRHLVLADPEFDVPGPVDMLIGGDLYPHMLHSKSDIIHSPGLPSALSTQLGWIVVGAMEEVSTTPMVSLTVGAIAEIDGLMRKFWTIEEPGTPDIPTTEEELCEEWFQKSTTRDASGRFCVSLPFRSIVCAPKEQSVTSRAPENGGSPPDLGSSRSLAVKRLHNLERRLHKDPELYDAYCKFMDEYRILGHMRPAIVPGKYFIPHHAVIKRGERGLKIRVVFDASAKSTSGKSLNDCLCTGPKLQTEIGDVLLRSRFYRYIFVADIAKMYRQIRVREEDCVYQHILWRSSPDEEIQEFQLLTVTYGVNAAPFLALRCLRQLDFDDGARFPLAKGLLISNTYVDDIVAGADSVEELLAVQKDLMNLLQLSKLELKKWASNCEAVLKRVPIEDHAIEPTFTPTNDVALKVLGVHWDHTKDVFGYHANTVDVALTKRSVLSTIARLYDPIGALGPVLLWAKGVMQELWIEKMEWDTPLPESLALKWRRFLEELPLLSRVSIPRHIDIRQTKEVHLVGFADASQRGYAAVVFIRTVDNLGKINVHFIACKTKIAPLKASQSDTTLTIPRLELCAALLLAKLLSHHIKLFENIIRIDRVQAWSDSTVVLAWLTRDQKQFKIFVTNRVAKIRALLPTCEWAHVGTSHNPADPASRGLLPRDLLSGSGPLSAPEFLWQEETRWPGMAAAEVAVSIMDDLPERKRPTQCILHVSNDAESDQLLVRFSSLTRMQRTVAFIFRFYNSASRRSAMVGSLKRSELDSALIAAVRMTQRVFLSALLKQLHNPDSPVTPPTLAQLAPFLDEHGIIRVGGRLRYSSMSYDQKHPILLPKVSHLTTLLIRHYHLSFLHGGPKLILAMLSRKFWILSGRDAVRRFIYTCVMCTRLKASRPAPLMGDLPSPRVELHRPFRHVGMDYGGPFVVKESRRRNSKTTKVYLALFVCMSIKAVHLEVVSDLTTDAFLAAFDRFVARRGVPSDIYSDCGTNYIGAARQLKALFDDPEMQTRASNRVASVWHFNPPAAPHFGGLWEAAIKSSKYHLRRVIGNQVFTIEELTTLVTRIEGILNSRPLTPMSADPNDLCPLTPGHFLIGQPIMSLPESNLKDVPMNRLDRWQLIRQGYQSFWKRWATEYLSTLQGRLKWFRQTPNMQIGDLVIVDAPNRPPTEWQMGRVIDVHPGEDQTVRVVTVRTQDSTLKRPVVKLVKLPVPV